MSDLSSQIRALRQKFGTKLAILGHHYQNDAILAHCDVVGDSLELARKVPSIEADILVFCGVYFMGESAALLTRPTQTVYTPDAHADCMMALMASGCHVHNVLNQLQSITKVLPIAYVNTSLGLKAVVGAFGGAVCTSANATTILAWALEQSPTVLFLPDRHLARNTAKSLGLTEQDWRILRLSGSSYADSEADIKGKRLLIWPGCCPVHAQMQVNDLESLRKQYPSIRIYVHPECDPCVVDQCDGAGSTSYLIKKTEEIAATQTKPLLAIGTEEHLVNRLIKRFQNTCSILPVRANMTCPDMQAITEEKLLETLQAIDQGVATPIQIAAAEQEPAKMALTRMLSVCSLK
ncbi:MAG: quinolinate synthase NadA [Desulfovibrio sp.]|nr:quinolinate synthase NadA [Desulfovibrio sp.]